MKNIVLITGATSGIGEATAILLAENNFDVIITGRREDRLLTLKNKIESQTEARVLSLNFDVRNLNEVNTAIESLPEEWQQINVLINNAGLAAGMSDLNNGDIADWEQMIDTNVKGLLYVSRAVSNKMIKIGSGHIINISSIAGKETYAMGNVYCATKHSVQALTQGMRLDFLKYGIKVSSICPGAVDTEFSLVRFKGDKERADKVYEGYTPLFAEDIAHTILFVLSRPPHVNIDDLLIMPTAQGFTRDFNKK